MRERRGRRKALVDTSAFYAFADSSDSRHREARAIFVTLQRQPAYLYTTSWIIAETHALLLNRLSQAAAIRFLRDTENESNIVVALAESNDIARGREIIYRHTDKRYSLTDATSFAIMERLQIPTAFTIDRNFAQFGWEIAVADR